MPNCKSFLVTEAERKHVRQRARFQQHRDASCHQVFFSSRQGAEGNSRHSERTLGEHAPSYDTVKNWVAQIKRGDFFLVLDDPKQWQPRRLLIKFKSWSWKTAGFRLNEQLSNWASRVLVLTYFKRVKDGTSNGWNMRNFKLYISNITSYILFFIIKWQFIF